MINGLINGLITHGGVIVILTPLVGSLLTWLWPQRAWMLGGLTSVLTAAIVIMMTVLLMPLSEQRYPVGGWGAPLGIDLMVDSLSLLMLLLVAVIALPLGLYVRSYFLNNTDKAASFWSQWLLLWTSLNALFLSWDIFNLYVTLELLGLAAVALVGLAQNKQALSGALRYLLVSLTGSLCYLLAVVLLYGRYGTLDITLLSQHMINAGQAGLTEHAVFALMAAGLMMKAALFPLHFWLPSAHGSAPAPVSAILSALVVKAAFYVLLRLWLNLFAASDTAITDMALVKQLLGALGAVAILWGSLQALRQTRLKLLIAYSTVAQVGYLFLGFALHQPLENAWAGVIILALSHGLAKSAMFLAAGNLLRLLKHDRITELDRTAARLPVTMAGFAMAGVSILGLPPSGGFAGKWVMLESTINQAQWWIAAVILIGSLLAGAYIFKVLGYAFIQRPQPLEVDSTVPASMEWPVFILGLLALLLGLSAITPFNWLASVLPGGVT